MTDLVADILGRLETLYPKLIDLELDRTFALLDKLGNPHHNLPSVVHIAGTNGKGSVLAFLRAILEASGRSVHVYTSPHLIRFNERIVLAGSVIEDEALAALLAETERVNDAKPITLFEVITCAAFLAFSRVPADTLLLETGLGGSFDATNVIEAPAITAITPVSLDHENFLGQTLQAIAGEKAGILKPGTPAIVGEQRPEAMQTIMARAAATGSPLFVRDRDWHVVHGAQGAAYRDAEREIPLHDLGLHGIHQIDNAAQAVAIAEQLVHPQIGKGLIVEGLTKANWPGRLQHITGGKLRALVPPDWEIWVDGGHNAAAGEVLARVAQDWKTDGRSLTVVFAMMAAKDVSGFLTPLAPLTAELIAVPVPGEEAGLPAEQAAKAARELGIEARPASSVPVALRDLATRHDQPARVLICGSLYLAGSVLAYERFDSTQS